jgi:uncharacterized membrane protein
MIKDKDIATQLLDKLNGLMTRQDSFRNEIEELRKEIHKLGVQETKSAIEPVILDQASVAENQEKQIHKNPKKLAFYGRKRPELKLNVEKFIGENLINKIGIIITVIGVGIGAKYAIDHELISPWTRIILGYILGLGLLGFAFRLRKEYENFSAVLLSGSMAIMYFITFAAYSFFALIPPALTFSLMVLFTLFTVAAAIQYNKQVIAHIGLVGAYAVPFLLSDGSGKVVILFSYMTIINMGILAIAFRKYWKPLYYSSFIITWLIFITWFIPKYEVTLHFELSWTFISIFFVTFYCIFLSYKLLRKEIFAVEDIILLLVNSVVFYGLGYAILHRYIVGEDYQGLFTLGNALIHYVVSIIIYRQGHADKNLFYFTAGLVIAFLTLAIPVQLDGNWVTMLWSVEAAVLFWIGRTKNAVVYELLSYPLMVLAFLSIVIGWPGVYNNLGTLQTIDRIVPLFNINFLASALFIASFVFINLINGKKQFASPLIRQTSLLQNMNFVMPGMLLIVLYFSFYLEIETFWNQRYIETMVTIHNGPRGVQEYFNDNINAYRTISEFIYSLLFLSILSALNILKLQKNLLGKINLGMNALAVGMFLVTGLIALGNLRENYLSQALSDYFYRGILDIGIRYVSFVFLAVMLYAVYRYIQQKFLDADLRKGFDIFLHITLLTIASNELINWMDLLGSGQSYKLGLSILFGIYALLLIALGIWKKKLHLRIGAIALFSATLLKLFFYDLTYLDTISKTIVFIVLGLLLLVISFLYNKYKNVIFEDRVESS